MPSVSPPRRPLPARVYWFRRGLVLVVALVLVLGVRTVLSSFGGADSSGRTSKATAVSQKQQPVPSTSPMAPSTGKTGPTTTPVAQPTPSASPLSEPTGACNDADITVKPTVTAVQGGGTVALPLALTTTSGTCTWQVSSQNLVLKITSGTDRVWSSQDCPAAVTSQSVVVRPSSEVPTAVIISWSGQRSTVGCPTGQGWADPGYYHLTAATLGGQPSDVQFQVAAPARPTVTKTAKPKKSPTRKPGKVKTPAG